MNLFKNLLSAVQRHVQLGRFLKRLQLLQHWDHDAGSGLRSPAWSCANTASVAALTNTTQTGIKLVAEHKAAKRGEEIAGKVLNLC